MDKEHPGTRGLNDFVTDDELYTCLVGDAPIHLLAQAKSKVDQQNHPQAYVRDYGQGRVFLTTLGNDVRAYTNSVVPQLIRQGTAWAAGKPDAGDPPVRFGRAGSSSNLLSDPHPGLPSDIRFQLRSSDSTAAIRSTAGGSGGGDPATE